MEASIIHYYFTVVCGGLLTYFADFVCNATEAVMRSSVFQGASWPAKYPKHDKILVDFIQSTPRTKKFLSFLILISNPARCCALRILSAMKSDGASKQVTASLFLCK